MSGATVLLRQPGEQYLPDEICALFGVCRKTVIRWATRGQIPAAKTPGGRWRFPAGPVNELLFAHGLLNPAEQLPGQFVLSL